MLGARWKIYKHIDSIWFGCHFCLRSAPPLPTFLSVCEQSQLLLGASCWSSSRYLTLIYALVVALKLISEWRPAPKTKFNSPQKALSKNPQSSAIKAKSVKFIKSLKRINTTKAEIKQKGKCFFFHLKGGKVLKEGRKKKREREGLNCS